MDNKRLILAMIIGLVVLLGWGWGIQYLDRKNGWNLSGRPTTQPVAATLPSGAGRSTETALTPAVVPNAGTTQGAIGATPGQPTVSQAEATKVVIGSIDPASSFKMALALTSRGAAVERVTLNEFKKQIGSDERYIFQEPIGTENALATNDIRIGSTRISTNTDWKLEESTDRSAVFSVEVSGVGGERFKITKRYTLDANAAPSLGYEVAVETTIANIGSTSSAVGLGMNGTIAPPFEIEKGPERQVLHAYVDATRRQMLVRHTMVETFTTEKPTIDVTKDHDNPHQLAWFGANGAYFNAIVRPIDAGGAPAAAWLASVHGSWLNTSQTDTHLRNILTTFTVAPVELVPNTSNTVTAKVYFGPKKRDILKTDYYASYPVAFDETLVLTSGICGICTFQWLIGVLGHALTFFHTLVRDWGVSIIVLVLVVRTLLHPITRKSQENMMKMGKMGPAMEEIKKKYADDKDAQQRAMMAIYKEQGMTPILGCLPMILQMPIWIALYSSLQSTFELRQAPFLYNLTWITDLSKPDHLIAFSRSYSLFGLVHISGLNLIPFLLAIVFFLQQHFTPKPPATTDEQKMQQNMMKWMTLIFPVFLYNMPAGLTIYILTSTSFGILESKIIRDKLKALDAAQAAGTVSVVDVPPSARPGKAKYNNAPAAPKKKGLMGWMEDMQAKVEEIKKEQEKKDKGKGK